VKCISIRPQRCGNSDLCGLREFIARKAGLRRHGSDEVKDHWAVFPGFGERESELLALCAAFTVTYSDQQRYSLRDMLNFEV
jgi:hypothetical protein